MQAAKPIEVQQAEDGQQGSDIKAIEAYHIALAMYMGLLRSILTAYGGYECKEPEPGKVTLAFEYVSLIVFGS